MSKKIFATLLAALFILSIALVAVPTQAHHTLGRLTDNPSSATPYRVRDFDVHVPGPTGYVWPGGGYGSYVGPSPMGPISQGMPGYQSPWSPNPPGASLDWYQLRGNAYAPFGAILTGAKGDLIIAINFTTHGIDESALKDYYAYDDVIIYVPPEFKPPVDWASYDTSNIIASWDNRYVDYGVVKADVKDAFGPGWWVIQIWSTINFTRANNYKEWYYIRLNGMTAPEIAGRYFFKIFLNESWPIVNSVDETGNNIKPVTSTMPVENWPVLLVKGEVDPGIIEGTVRYGAWNTTLYNQPLQVPGRVRAVGVTPEGRQVEARGYFNASAKGHFEIEGVAPGTYDIYASAAGFPEQKVASGVEVKAGKSTHLDVYLNPGVVVHGKIFSKHIYQEVPWPSDRPIMVEIYDSNEWPSAKPGYAWDSKGLEFEAAHLKSFSPINLTECPYTSYVVGNVIYDASGTKLATGNTPKLVAFPWEGPSPGPDPDGIFNGVGPSQVWWVGPSAITADPAHVGDNWFIFRFGVTGRYGAPTEFDGHVPQVFATWVNGLGPGKYYLRAWVNGYVQTDALGNYVDYSFEVAGEEWAGDVYVPMDLQTSSWINKTVHFHDLPGTLATQPVGGPDPKRYLIAEVYDANNVLVGFNFTIVKSTDKDVSIMINGFGMAGPDDGHVVSDLNGMKFSHLNGMKFSLYKYRHIRDYGIMPGTYSVRVYMRGYVQQEIESTTISLSSSPAYISNHMYRGAGINVTLYSIDWQHPAMPKPWVWPGAPIVVEVYDNASNPIGEIKYWDGSVWKRPKQVEGNTTIPYEGWEGLSKLKFNGSTAVDGYGPDADSWSSWRTATDERGNVWWLSYFRVASFLADPSMYRKADLSTKLGLETGTYKIKGFTYGYVDRFWEEEKAGIGKTTEVYVQKGHQADTKLQLIVGVNITVTIKFKKEGIFDHVPYNSSMRVRLFDKNGKLVGALESSLSTFVKTTDKEKIALISYIRPSWAPESEWVKTDVVPDNTTTVIVLIAGAGRRYIEPDWYNVVPKNRDMYNGYGIAGSKYLGGDYFYSEPWTVEVDVVNCYYSNAWYPPPPGLLMGESYHIIAGVEGPYGNQWSFNHLGPFEQRTVWTVPNAPLSGEASVYYELDLRGLVSGLVYGFTYSNGIRPISWASAEAVGESGTFTVYTYDGYYEMYLSPGSYTLTVTEWPGGAGHEIASAPITVSEGQLVTGFSFTLEESHIPIPEFPVAAIALISAIAASLYILRRIKK
jgi:hypothetical protein